MFENWELFTTHKRGTVDINKEKRKKKIARL